MKTSNKHPAIHFKDLKSYLYNLYLHKESNTSLITENRLKDFTDSLGSLRFDFMIKKHAMHIPYLYKATHKNGTELTIFGSMHSLSTSSLPQNLKLFLESFDILLSEALSLENFDRMNGMIQIEQTPEEEPELNRQFPNWFEQMPTRVQQDLETAFSTEYDSNNVELLLSSDDMLNTLQQYSLLTYIDGIDSQLLSYYYQQSDKTIRPIDGYNAYEETIMNENKWMNVYSYESMMEVIAQDHYDSYILNGGAKMSDWNLTLEYLSHSCKADEDDITLLKRNKTWLKNIYKNAKEFTDKTKLLVGGVSHMLGKHGLIELLHKDGFTIQSLNLEGENFQTTEEHKELCLLGDIGD